MSSETPTQPMTRAESLLSCELPVEQRQQSLVQIQHLERPDHDTIAAVVPLLNDTDPVMRSMAQNCLTVWGQPAVTVLLKALRGTLPQEVPYRLAILEQLRRMGPTAKRAETLLRNLASDKDIGEAAQQTLRVIRQEGADLSTRLLHTLVELFFLALVVAGPLVAMRQAFPAKDLPPLGLVIGMASLAVVGIMLARLAYSSDLLERSPTSEPQPSEWALFAMLGLAGAVVGSAMAVICWAWGDKLQHWFR